MPRYIVHTTCRATVEERWSIISPEPLTAKQIEQLLTSSASEELDEKCKMECTDQEVTGDEEERTIDEIEDAYEDSPITPSEPPSIRGLINRREQDVRDGKLR